MNNKLIANHEEENNLTHSATNKYHKLLVRFGGKEHVLEHFSKISADNLTEKDLIALMKKLGLTVSENGHIEQAQLAQLPTEVTNNVPLITAIIKHTKSISSSIFSTLSPAARNDVSLIEYIIYRLPSIDHTIFSNIGPDVKNNDHILELIIKNISPQSAYSLYMAMSKEQKASPAVTSAIAKIADIKLLHALCRSNNNLFIEFHISSRLLKIGSEQKAGERAIQQGDLPLLRDIFRSQSVDVLSNFLDKFFSTLPISEKAPLEIIPEKHYDHPKVIESILKNVYNTYGTKKIPWILNEFAGLQSINSKANSMKNSILYSRLPDAVREAALAWFGPTQADKTVIRSFYNFRKKNLQLFLNKYFIDLISEYALSLSAKEQLYRKLDDAAITEQESAVLIKNRIPAKEKAIALSGLAKIIRCALPLELIAEVLMSFPASLVNKALAQQYLPKTVQNQAIQYNHLAEYQASDQLNKKIAFLRKLNTTEVTLNDPLVIEILKVFFQERVDVIKLTAMLKKLNDVQEILVAAKTEITTEDIPYTDAKGTYTGQGEIRTHEITTPEHIKRISKAPSFTRLIIDHLPSNISKRHLKYIQELRAG